MGVKILKIINMSNNKLTYGLIGKNISYSFSKKYFLGKFKELNKNDCEYLNFDLHEISELKKIFKFHKKIKGLNVTIPYKQEIIPFLDDISAEAKKIGAVNTIKIKNDKLIGFNTDVYGFEKSLTSIIKPSKELAIILGWGGASKAVKHVLDKFGFKVIIISRKPNNNQALAYHQLSKELIKETKLIVNCTPLGTFPKVNDCPKIPYQFLNKQHTLFDLIYNPPITKFLENGLEKGAKIKNGADMLKFQAEKSWEIWNS